VDLSERGRTDRAAMRQRGEISADDRVDQCAKFVATTGAPGSGGASVDEIVAGLRSYPGRGGRYPDRPVQREPGAARALGAGGSAAQLDAATDGSYRRRPLSGAAQALGIRQSA
jgi:hypothetical protein